MSAAKKDKKETKSKVFDVAKPGSTAPSANARSVIIRHEGSITQDPMVNDLKKAKTNPEDSADDTAPEIEDQQLRTSEKKTISPPEPAEEVADPEEEEEPEEKSGETSESAEVDAIAEEVGSKKATDKADREADKRSEELQKIIDSKKYFVPIGEEAHRGSRGMKIFLVTVTCILLALVIFDLVLDAEMIDVGVKPLTNFL